MRHGKTTRSAGQTALCAALVEARARAGLSQAELALRLRGHQSLVARIESGERRIDVIELIVLARALEIDSADILQAAERATPANHRI